MKPTKVTRFRCDECEELHENEYDAQECCRMEPDTTKMTVWKCSSCDECYDDKEVASECCKE